MNPHLHEPDYLQRIARLITDPDDIVVVEDAAEPVTQRRKHKPSLTKAIRQAVKAGATVSGATITSDGSVVLTFSDGSTTTSDNPWDRVLRSAAN